MKMTAKNEDVKELIDQYYAVDSSTYVGAKSGRIITAMNAAGVKNPVLLRKVAVEKSKGVDIKVTKTLMKKRLGLPYEEEKPDDHRDRWC